MDIEIDIDDERHFTDVASIVDRKDFAQEIKRLQAIFKKDSIHDEKKIEFEIDKSRQRLYLPIIYKGVIAAATFRGKISSQNYSPAYLTSNWKGQSFNDEGITPDETHSIILSPEARDEDVIKAFQEYRDQLGNFKGAHKYKYLHRVWDLNRKKPSIKMHRKWYWDIKLRRKTFKAICGEETENCPVETVHTSDKKKPKDCTCYDESTIRKAIDNYNDLIWKTPTL